MQNQDFFKRCQVVLDVLILKLKEKNFILANNIHKNDLNNEDNQFYYYCEIDDGYIHYGIELIVFNPSINNCETIVGFNINPNKKCIHKKSCIDVKYNSINDIVEYIIETVNYEIEIMYEDEYVNFKDIIENLFKEENIQNKNDKIELLKDVIYYDEKQQHSSIMLKIKKKYTNIIQYNLFREYDWLFTITIDFIDNLYSINTEFSKYNLDISEIIHFTPFNLIDDIKEIIKEYIIKFSL